MPLGQSITYNRSCNLTRYVTILSIVCTSKGFWAVQWLRHTGISEDVKTRPREHVRDDAGHSSSAITDRYIDVELVERAKSAKKKPMVEDLNAV